MKSLTHPLFLLVDGNVIEPESGTALWIYVLFYIIPIVAMVFLVRWYIKRARANKRRM